MKLTVDFDEATGKIKPMNAVNNGPVYKKNANATFNTGNMGTYTEANIPFARTHDASFCADYGGEHTVDITAVFPDLDADPYLAESYDFHFTDEYCETIMTAGTKVFFRLGQKIEHGTKKYGIYPPRDFKKWAVICQHLIAHLNEGWANGHHYGIEYFEIWNEPDLYGKCWLGTPEQFYELYAVTARHLKNCYPNLKIGGPAVTGYNETWLRPFFEKIRAEYIPMDFFSWHGYAKEPREVVDAVRKFRMLLDEYGLENVQSILNEWNYVISFKGEEFIKTVETETGIKGAAFIAAVMAACQAEPVDMLMYYDARPCRMNGLFSFYTYRPLKGYFAVKIWGEFLKMGCSCKVECDVPNIYAAAAKDESGEKAVMVSYYTDNNSAVTQTLEIDLAGTDGQTDVYLLDEKHDMTKVFSAEPENGSLKLVIEPNTVVLLRAK